MKERITTMIRVFGVMLYFVASYFGAKYAPLLLPAFLKQPIIVFFFRLVAVLVAILLVDYINNFIRSKLGYGDQPYSKSGYLHSNKLMLN